MKRLLTVGIFCLPIACALQAQDESLKNLKVFPEDTTRKEIVAVMRSWAGDLGVRCTHCHYSPTGKFDDMQFDQDKKEPKETARQMYKMVNQINEMFFKERDFKVTCYTCHHGSNNPRKLEEILASSLADGGVEQVDETYREMRKKYYGQGAYNFAAWSGLAVVASGLLQAQEWDGFRHLHELNLEFNPDYDGSHSAMAAYYIQTLADEDKAREHLKASMKGNAFWTPRRMLRLAQRYRDEADSTRLLLTLRLTAEIAPTNAEANFQLGNALRENGDTQGAKAAYQAALAAQPGHEGATTALKNL